MLIKPELIDGSNINKIGRYAVEVTMKFEGIVTRTQATATEQ